MHKRKRGFLAFPYVFDITVVCAYTHHKFTIFYVFLIVKSLKHALCVQVMSIVTVEGSVL